MSNRSQTFTEDTEQTIDSYELKIEKSVFGPKNGLVVNTSCTINIGVGMICTLGGLIQFHVQYIYSVRRQTWTRIKNIEGVIAPLPPMVPTHMIKKPEVNCHELQSP